MVVTAIIGIICGALGIDGMPALPTSMSLTFEMDAAGAFMNGFSELFANPMNAIVIIFSFLFVDFFDTAGTLVAIGNEIGLVNKQGGGRG